MPKGQNTNNLKIWLKPSGNHACKERHGDWGDVVGAVRLGHALDLLLQPPHHVAALVLVRQHGQQDLVR